MINGVKIKDINELIKEYENEIMVEKLAGNVVKEAQARGIVMGLKMAQKEMQNSLNRDALVDIMCEELHGLPLKEMWKEGSREYLLFIKAADAIISKQHGLLEVVK